MSLARTCSGCPIVGMTVAHLDDDHICKVGEPILVGAEMNSLRKRDSRLLDASEETIQSAANLHRARKNLSSLITSRTNVAIHRWLRSYDDIRELRIPPVCLRWLNWSGWGEKVVCRCG